MKRRHRARIVDVADADPVRAWGGGPGLRVGSEGRVAGPVEGGCYGLVRLLTVLGWECWSGGIMGVGGADLVVLESHLWWCLLLCSGVRFLVTWFVECLYNTCPYLRAYRDHCMLPKVSIHSPLP